jgi:hypothetical protein
MLAEARAAANDAAAAAQQAQADLQDLSGAYNTLEVWGRQREVYLLRCIWGTGFHAHEM